MDFSLFSLSFFLLVILIAIVDMGYFSLGANGP